MELYQNLGFKENPFSTFSAEEERSFLNNIYINPRFYDTLKADLDKGLSRFILGARGIGKTALLMKLKIDLENEDVFTLIIDNFDNIPSKDNETELTKLIIEELILSYCIRLSKYPKYLKKLDTTQKEKLSFIIKEFFRTLSKSQYEKLYNKADHIKKRNFFRNIWNYLFNKPINYLISGSIDIVADTVRKSLGLPESNNKDFYKNYLPELTLEEINKDSNPERFLSNYKILKEILNDLCEIISSSGFKTSIIFFDKIDEYTKLNSNIISVAEFLEKYLKDTTLLMNNSYALVFSIWDVLKPELSNKGVRFDKIKPYDITWQIEDLKDILDKRISYFSENKKSTKNIIESEEKLNEIISLSNNSPRYLFRLLSCIYDQQSIINKNVSILSEKAIKKGQLEYAKSFDYYAIYPTKRGSKEDILTNVNRLLRIGKEKIKTTDFVEIFKVSTQTAISYIKIIQGYNLVRELPETESGAKLYEINDPVIKCLIKNNIREFAK